MNTRKNRIKFFALVVICLLLNLALSGIASSLKLPFYFDCVGTILASIAGGYLPGIMVGFLTNLIIGFSDATTTYYSIISILIAITASYFSYKGYFTIKKPLKAIVPVLIFVLIGGGIGSMLTWEIYGNSIGQELSSDIVNDIYKNYINNPFIASLVGGIVIDFPDKLISSLVAFSLYLAIPKRLFPRKHNFEISKSNSKRASLGTKLIILVSAGVMAVAMAVSFVSYGQFKDTLIEDKGNYAMNVAKNAASYIDPEMINAYIQNGEAAPGYIETEEKLRIIYSSSDQIEFLYVYRIEEDGCHVVFDIDTPGYEGNNPGDVIPFDPGFADYIPNLLDGEEIDPIVTNDTFGWLLTAYTPVYDVSGRCVCYVAADISMPNLALTERVFVVKTLAMLMGFFSVILAIGLTLANLFIVEPVNALAAATETLNYDNDEARSETVEKLRGLVISTGDEIEHLYHALTKSTQDTIEYISESQRKSEALEQLQNVMINVMADLVESRDPSTGTHIKSTAAYVQIIVDQLRKDSDYSERITDEFVADVVASAPLHDIGKIMIPDSILTKPGKLTDEEYEIMKTHTTSGAKIIEDVISKAGNARTGYLKEARNMALYHHEKWTGNGYPEGISGEDIPLSARIMAVADVFDALISKRCYKPAFTFEEAMKIIKKDAGKHFDPVIVQAFIDASDKVREVTENDSDE